MQDINQRYVDQATQNLLVADDALTKAHRAVSDCKEKLLETARLLALDIGHQRAVAAEGAEIRKNGGWA